MPTYPLSPGAWLGGGAGLSPPFLRLSPPFGAQSPPFGSQSPPFGAQSPPFGNQSPPFGAQSPPFWNQSPPFGNQSPPFPSNPAMPVATGAGPLQPWQGVDPAWVYQSGEQALLAQALSKVRARIVKPDNPRRAKAMPGRVRDANNQSEPLWRWQPEFRGKAVEAELLARVAVHGQRVWWLPVPSHKAPRIVAKPLFTLLPRAADFQYDVQIDKVLRAAIEREDRLPEILTQAGDIGVFFDAVTGIDHHATPCLAELLDVVWNVSLTLVMALKNEVAEFRPVQRSAQVQPVMATPGHGSLPSGHATLARVTAVLLSALLAEKDSQRRVQLDLLARRIAFNRVVAGLHFPMDSFAGYALGGQLAAVFVAAATGQDLPDKVDCKVEADSTLTEAIPAADAAAITRAPATAAAAARDAAGRPAPDRARAAPLLGMLFDAAAAEIAALRVRRA